MKIKTIFLIVILTGMLIIAGCTGHTTSDSAGHQTEAALFAQATLTKAALLTQMAVASTSTPEATLTASSQPPTATSQQPTQVPTVTFTSPAPQPTSLPPICKPVRLSFADGSTNINQDGVIGANVRCRYIFWGEKDQLISVAYVSSNPLSISISDADGRVLLPFSNEASYYQGYLTSSGDWYLDLKANSADAIYSFYLEIPERLNFPPGSYEKSATGTIIAADVHNFIVWAKQGQKLTVNVNPIGNAVLEIYQINGSVLLPSQNNSSSFELTLPELGDYMINVINQTDNPLDYSLNIEIR